MNPGEESRNKVAAESCSGPIQMDQDKHLSADLALNQANEIPCPSPSKKQLPTSTTIPRERSKQTGVNKRRHLTELSTTKGTTARQLASAIGSEQRRRSAHQSLNKPHPAKLSSQQRRPRRKGPKLVATTASSNLIDSHKNSELLSTLVGTTNSEIAQQMDQNCEQLSNQTHPNQSVYVCSGCQKPIRERYLFRACDKFWHNRCLKCDRCQAKLGELGSSFYLVGEMNLCRQDYYEMFAHKAICAVCDKLIYASEMVMRARDNVYHLECFACQLCGLRFCVGDQFHLCENKIVCQFDFDEHIYPIQQQQQHYAQFNSQTGVQLDLVPMHQIDCTQQEPVGSLALGSQLIHDEGVEKQQTEFNGFNQANCHETLVYHTMESGNTIELSSASAEQIKPTTPQPLHEQDHDRAGSDKAHVPGGASPADEVETRREPIPETGSG